MLREKYYELIYRLCKLTGIDNVTAMRELCEVQFGGVEFALSHGGDVDEDGLYIYCDFGSVDEERKAMVFERLMQTNLLTFGNGTPVFGFDSQRRMVILMLRLLVSQTSFEALVTHLYAFTAHIETWHNFIFAEDYEEVMKQMVSSPPAIQ